MSFWGRLENLVHIGTSWDMMRYVERKEHETFVEKYGKNFPTMDVKKRVYKTTVKFRNSIRELSWSSRTLSPTLTFPDSRIIKYWTLVASPMRSRDLWIK